MNQENKNPQAIMKNFLCTLSILLALAPFCFGQDKMPPTEKRWTRVETQDKEVSVSIPSDFLTDAVKKEYNNQLLRLIAFQNGAQMELLIYAENNPKKYLSQLEAPQSKKIGDGAFILKRFPGGDKDQYFAETIYLASKNKLYCFFVRAETGDNPEISRFLYSIEAGGKPIFINDSADKNAMPATTVSTTELKTSPEIMTALSQKSEKSDRKITYEFKTVKLPETAFDFLMRPYVILVDPHPQFASYSVRPTIISSRADRNDGKATFKVELLSGGQVGDITVFSTSDRRILYEFIEGIKKVRFLPALKDGNPIDSEWNFELESFDF
jgi:hypothetical protein